MKRGVGVTTNPPTFIGGGISDLQITTEAVQEYKTVVGPVNGDAVYKLEETLYPNLRTQRESSLDQIVPNSSLGIDLVLLRAGLVRPNAPVDKGC